MIADGLHLTATEPAFVEAIIHAELDDVPGRTQLDSLVEAYGLSSC